MKVIDSGFWLVEHISRGLFDVNFVILSDWHWRIANLNRGSANVQSMLKQGATKGYELTTQAKSKMVRGNGTKWKWLRVTLLL